MSYRNIIPYADFPKKKPKAAKPTPTPIVEDVLTELTGKDGPSIPTLDQWCHCQNCTLMDSVRERVCCFDVKESETLWARNWKSFISDEYNGCYANHPKIIEIVNRQSELDNFILQDQYYLKQIARLTRSTYVDEYAFSETNTKYRMASYRKITLLIHKTLRLKRQVEILACVINYVRKTNLSDSGEYEEFEDYIFDVDIE